MMKWNFFCSSGKWNEKESKSSFASVRRLCARAYLNRLFLTERATPKYVVCAINTCNCAFGKTDFTLKRTQSSVDLL